MTQQGDMRVQTNGFVSGKLLKRRVRHTVPDAFTPIAKVRPAAASHKRNT